MFYESVRLAWCSGKVRVGISASESRDVTIEADGIVGLKAMFLTRAERQRLADLSREAAREYVEDKPV